MTDIIESAAQIVVEVSGQEIVVTDLSLNDDFDMERNYGSNRLEADSLSFKKIERGGSLTLKGSKVELEDALFYQPGDDIPEGFEVHTPKPFVMTILLLNGNTKSRRDNYVTSGGFQFSEGETAETTYEFITMRAE